MPMQGDRKARIDTWQIVDLDAITDARATPNADGEVITVRYLTSGSGGAWERVEGPLAARLWVALCWQVYPEYDYVVGEDGS